MSVLLFIDFSNVARACWHPAEAAQKADPSKYDVHRVFKTNLRGKAQTIVDHTGEEPSARWLWVLDDHCAWRREVLPSYKAKRDPTAFDPRPEAREFLREEYPDTHWARSAGAEADDVIAALVAKRGQNDVVIVSGDRDLWQLLQPGVKIFLPSKKKFVTPEMVAEDFGGIEPAKLRLHKALWGDTSDGVPNVLPRKQKLFLPLIAKSDGTLDGLRREVAWDGPATQALTDEVLVKVSKNYDVVGLKQDVKVEFDPVG